MTAASEYPYGVDYSQIPCAGDGCFALPLADRKAAVEPKAECRRNGWHCRCCELCRKACEEPNGK